MVAESLARTVTCVGDRKASVKRAVEVVKTNVQAALERCIVYSKLYKKEISSLWVIRENGGSRLLRSRRCR